MKKLLKPYKTNGTGKCFGCSPENEHGLQMQFFEQDEYIISEWEPKSHLSGFKNILHGGIQTTILDEIASWVVFIKCKTAGVTIAINARFKSSVFTDKGKLTVRAKLISQDRRFANIHAEIIDTNGKVCSEAEVKYMIFPQEMAVKKFEYPGIKAFYE